MDALGRFGRGYNAKDQWANARGEPEDPSELLRSVQHTWASVIGPETRVSTHRDAKVAVKVVTAYGRELCYIMLFRQTFEKLMNAVCKEMKVLSRRSVRFLYNGSRIRSADTPWDLRMEEGAIVDIVLKHQVGHAAWGW